MKPVDQTLFGVEVGPKSGNCFSACVASILEVSLEEVPNFCAEEKWWEPCKKWFKDRGYCLFYFELSKEEKLRWDTGAYYIQSGKSPRGDWIHATVYKRGVMVHDPHPTRVGLESHTDMTFIFKEGLV